MTTRREKLIEICGVRQSFKKRDHQDLLVLDNINLTIYEGEIIAILGKSGSGKSTIMRIIAGLNTPSAGKVQYRNQVIHGPIKGLTMVFQNFALFPWLTTLQNVELGLEAQGVPKEERRARALKAIDILGMDGFESAYPKELSGGMCQRIGIARALVVNPDVLLMDEPFSALDVLTAENLRNDLLDIWHAKETNLKSIIFVTHNIEEAALLADRILILSTDICNIRSTLEVDIPHPRNDQSTKFRKLVSDVYTLMTTSKTVQATPLTCYPKAIQLHHRLPKAQISELAGLLESLHSPEYRDKGDLPKISEVLHLNIDDLFPLTEALEILGFAHVFDGDISLTDVGKHFAEADILQRKKIFSQQLLRCVPLARHVRSMLDRRSSHKVSEQYFLEELQDHLSEDDAKEVLRIVIDWGRYAELFAYDFNTGKFNLENPE